MILIAVSVDLKEKEIQIAFEQEKARKLIESGDGQKIESVITSGGSGRAL